MADGQLPKITACRCKSMDTELTEDPGGRDGAGNVFQDEWFVHCNACGLNGNAKPSESEAIFAWNRGLYE